MLSSLRRAARRVSPARVPLCLESLEARENPVQIVFDFTYDSGFLSNNAAARNELARAANDLGARLTTHLAAINPGGGNSWSARTFNPTNPNQNIDIANLTVPADTMIVFVGAFAVGGGEAGLGGFGGYSAQGSSAWFNTLSDRGTGGFGPWGGSLAFDPTANWSFNGAGPEAGKLDFYTVASHELGHLFGFGTAPEFQQWVLPNSGSPTFNGPNAKAAYGGTAPPLDASEAHYRQSTAVNGQVASMQPVVAAGTRVPFTNLDFAALADIGWNVSGVSAATSPVPQTSPQLGTAMGTGGGTPITVSGAADGTFQVYSVANGGLTATTSSIGDFAGQVRTAVGDVTGDGVPDVIAGAGPGGSPRLRVYDGATGNVAADFLAYAAEFDGGVFLATGDFDGDGRDDILVSADRGGGPNVRVYSLQGSNPVLVASFWGIDDTNFKGGTRISAGDVNGDGFDDLVVSAGFTGGPRVAIYDGRTVLSGSPSRLIGDFFAYEPTLNNGSYVAVGDFDGDGFADVAFGAGPNGGPRVKVLSGKLLSQQGGPAAVASPMADFFVGDTNARGGVRLTAADVDGDGVDDLVAAAGQNVGSQLWVYNGKSISGGSPTQIAGGVVYGGAALPDGVYVG